MSVGGRETGGEKLQGRYPEEDIGLYTVHITRPLPLDDGNYGLGAYMAWTWCIIGNPSEARYPSSIYYIYPVLEL